MKNTVISVKNLVKKFGSFTANDNLNFEVYEGEIFGFLGANGAGKTTALRILSGLSGPTSGEVIVAGYNAKKQPEQIKKNIGYMCQKFSLYEDLTVKENIMLYGGIYGMKKALVRERTYEAAGMGITVFVTTHYMDEAEYCDRISIMSEGKIVALDTPADLKRQYNAGSVEEVFVKIARPPISPPDKSGLRAGGIKPNTN